jgi:hypothetical protein
MGWAGSFARVAAIEILQALSGFLFGLFIWTYARLMFELLSVIVSGVFAG